MAIRGGGPPKPPVGPAGAPQDKQASASTESTAAPLDTPEPRSPEHLPNATPTRGSEQLAARAMLSLTEQLASIQPEAERLFALLAAQGFSGPILESSTRMRKRLDDLRRRLGKLRRAQHEQQAGLSNVTESEIAGLEDALEDIGQLSTEWARSFATLNLITESEDEPHEPRRLVMKGADREQAMAYAEAANLSTALADLTTSALAFCKRAESTTSADSSSESLLGPTLKVERRAAQLLSSSDPTD